MHSDALSQGLSLGYKSYQSVRQKNADKIVISLSPGRGVGEHCKSVIDLRRRIGKASVTHLKYQCGSCKTLSVEFRILYN